MKDSLFEITPEIAQFRQSKPWRDKLTVLMEDPVMQEAVKAVLSLSLPRSIPAPVPGNHPDTIIAHKFYNMLGVVKAMNMLQALTTDGGPSGMEPTPEEEAFTAELPPELQQPPEGLKAR